MDPQKNSKDHLLVSIKEFLEGCLIYESLPQNSQVIIVDKSFSCLDTLKVFVENDCVDCVTWNSNIAFFERILTYTDICEVIVKVFLNIISKVDNKDYFEESNMEIEREGAFEMEITNMVGEKLRLEDNNKGPRFAPAHTTHPEPLDETQHVREKMKGFKCSPEVKAQLVKDLKALNLKAWFNRSGSELHKNAEIISIDLEKRLVDACEKMKSENLHRIIILDREKQLFVGTLTHRDILLFIIRNFKGKAADYFKTPLMKLGIIGALEKPITINKNESLLTTFYFMLRKKLSSIPIIDEKEQYFGLINKTDMFFIIKDNLFEMLTGTTEEYLNFLNKEKKKYKATKLECSQFYTPNDSISDIVEKLLFSNGNRLFYLNENTKKIVGLITLTDLFKFYLDMK